MGNFKQIGGKRFNKSSGGGYGKRNGSRPNFGSKSWGDPNDRDRGPVTMHQAVCGQCGKPCEVPFRPISGKTVYCADCFKDKKETGNYRESNKFPKKKFDGYRASREADFGSDASSTDNDAVKKHLEILEAKIDRLIKAVETMANAKSSDNKTG